jgi:hypothetical protein
MIWVKINLENSRKIRDNKKLKIINLFDKKLNLYFQISFLDIMFSYNWLLKF